MKFTLPIDKRNLTDKDLLDDLKKVASGLGKNQLGYDEYDKLGIVRSRTIEVRFNGWNNALTKAGLEVQRQVNIPDTDLFEEILRIWTLKGKHPGREDLEKYNCKWSKSTYERRFGGWRKSLEAFVNYINEREDDIEFEGQKQEPENRTKRTPRFPNLRLRFLTLKRAGFKCENCGRSPATTLGLELHVDHHIPYSKGGETVLDNLKCLCDKCNLGKSDL